LLTDRERRDIKLWFGWGAVLGYSTNPRAYLREAMKPANKPLFLAVPRAKRKEILQFVIHEDYVRRFQWPWK
jgi:hypothetical protein